MILIVCGSRGVDAALADHLVQNVVREAMEHWGVDEAITRVLHGGAEGVDAAADRWARSRGLEVEVFRPLYRTHPPKLAPKVRNRAMAAAAREYAARGERAGCVGIWRDDSSGTANMMTHAAAEKLLTYVERLDR